MIVSKIDRILRISSIVDLILAKKGYKPGTIKDKDLSADGCGKTKRRHRTKRLPPRIDSRKFDAINKLTDESRKDSKDTVGDKDFNRLRKRRKRKA